MCNMDCNDDFLRGRNLAVIVQTNVWRIPLVDNVGKNKAYRNYEASIRNSQVLVSKKKNLPIGNEC